MKIYKADLIKRPKPDDSRLWWNWQQEDIRFQGKDYAGTDNLGKVCRKIIWDTGEDATLQVYRAGVLQYTVKSIAIRAEQILVESKGSGLCYRSYNSPDLLHVDAKVGGVAPSEG